MERKTTSRRQKNRMRRYRYKAGFIIQSVFFLALTLFFVWALFGVMLIEEYPEKAELTYEECTFIKYEKIERRYNRHSKMRYYYLYVEEYDQPLEIDNIVFPVTNEEALQRLKQGDKVTVSLYEYKGEINLYEAFCGSDSILNYEDYLSKHNGNNELGVIVCSVFICASIGLLFAGIVHYRKTGNSLFLR